MFKYKIECYQTLKAKDDLKMVKDNLNIRMTSSILLKFYRGQLINDHPVGTFVDSSSTAASSKVKKSFGDDWLPNGSCLSDLL